MANGIGDKMGGMVFIVILALIIISFYFTKKSLESLSFKHSSYYDFGRYIPNGGNWVVFLFLFFLVLIIAVFAIFIKVNFKYFPA